MGGVVVPAFAGTRVGEGAFEEDIQSSILGLFVIGSEVAVVGTFSWPLRIASMDGDKWREIEATVDTGAAYTTLPGQLLRDLGVVAVDKRRFLLADGRRVWNDIGRAWVTIDGKSEVTLVVFGEDDAPPLLGAYTLEGLALAVDPVEQKLVPTNLILY